jgi:isopenicillin N synthase-like dioxygenase
MELVPTIDIGRPAEGELEAVDAACSDHGFFLLEGHGLDDLIERTWQETRRLFAAPAEVKAGLRRSEDQPLGYYDRELTKRKRDCKEVFDYMEPSSAVGQRRNRWPEALPGFRETQAEFFAGFSKLAEQTLRLVHTALGASESVASSHAGSALTSTVRLNHYPVGDPVPADERDALPELGETALGHHTDPGVLTLLLQDDTGGLQAHSRDDGWIDVPPRPGTIVVNLADSLQVWTNDRYRAAVHRVVPMTQRERYSIPYFYNPGLEAVIQPIAELGEEGPRYRPFTWREFIQARVDDNFTDLGDEDTQASHYRIAPSGASA